jgi:hypothetical protein
MRGQRLSVPRSSHYFEVLDRLFHHAHLVTVGMTD